MLCGGLKVERDSKNRPPNGRVSELQGKCMVNLRTCGWWKVKCTNTTRSNRHQVLKSTCRRKWKFWQDKKLQRKVKIHYKETDVLHIPYPAEMIFNELATAFNKLKLKHDNRCHVFIPNEKKYITFIFKLRSGCLRR